MDTIDRKWRQQNICVDRTQRRQKTQEMMIKPTETYNIWYDTIKTTFMHNALQLDQ